MDRDRITIETPEHIRVEYELAGVVSRILAGLLDTLLQGLITAGVVGVLLLFVFRLGSKDALGLTGAIVVSSTGFLAATAYFVISEIVTDGRSFGKKMSGLRVVRVDGSPITLLDSLIRNIIRAIDILPCCYTIGLFSIFCSKHSQRLGDLLAGTLVIKERLYEPAGEVAEEELELLQPAPTVSPEVLARLRNSLHLLAPADFTAAERYLTRRHELTLELRQRLGSQVANTLLSKMAQPPAPTLEAAETTLQALVQLWRDKPL